MSRFHQTTRWLRLSRWIKDRDGFRCRKCGKAGRLETDHRAPIASGGKPWDPANLQALCRNCHFKKSAKERLINPGLQSPKLKEWDALVDKLRN